MAKRRVCPHCKEEFFSDKDEFHHLKRWGCRKMYEALTEYAAPLCGCGCGQKVELSKRNTEQYNKFVRGHNRKAKKGEQNG